MALSSFHVHIVFTLGLLLGSASVWAGGGEGPGPPQWRGGGARTVMKGTSLRLPCSAPDPRIAARSKPKHNNMLDIGNAYRASSEDVNKDFDSSPDSYYKSDYDNEPDYAEGNEDEKHSSDFELSDDDFIIYDEIPPRRANVDKYRKRQRAKENRKLERKQLDGGRFRKMRPKPEIRDDEDYEGVKKEVASVTYVWFHNGTEISSNESRRSIQSDGTLFFKKFGKIQKGGLQDTGEYRCLARASSGATISPIINITYAFIDREFTKYPVDTEVYEGDSVKFSCDIRSNPLPKITWMKDAKPLVLNKRIYSLSATSILLTDMNADDNGKYRCVAKNSIVNKTRSSPDCFITVLKQQQTVYPISFVSEVFDNYNETQVKHIKNVTVHFGDNVLLSCAVNGKPKPKVVWSYQSETSNVEVKEISSMEVHKIRNITEDKSGTYTCIANNMHQSIKQVYHVTVLRAPYFYLFPVSDCSPTAITVRFNCSAGGSPTPKLVWYRDGQLLNITGRVKLKAQGNKPPELIISDTISGDKGIYQCVASNEVGEVSTWASLMVQTQNIPPPYNVKCKPIGPDAVRITWSPPKESVVAYTVHFVLADGGEERSQILTAEEFDLKKLEIYRKYDIYIKAYNINGASDQSEHIICYGQGVRIYLSSLPNSSIHISWREPTNSVKSWVVQWKQMNNNNSVAAINNVTLPASANSYIVSDAFPLDKYEFRVLATPSDEWSPQDLEFIPWTSAKNRTIIPYKETLALKNNSHGPEFDASSPVQNPDIIDWNDYPRPTNVLAKALGPHSINISWTCDAAESSSDAYSFEVCYSQNSYLSSDTKTFRMERKNETCHPSFNTWYIIRGLEPGTFYAIRIQAVMQNKYIGGPYSETVICRTRRDEKSSISDVRWKKISDNVLEISWTHIINSNMMEDDDSFIELSEDGGDDHYTALKRSWTYTVRYSQDLTSPLEQWPSKNVTDDTHIELKDLDPEKGCFVMVFLNGENKGSPLNITSKEMKIAQVETVEKHGNKHIGIILGLCFLLLCIMILLIVVTWHRKKLRREQELQLSVQMRSRGGKSDYECQELMTQPPYSDSKFLGKKHMGNGNCKPLLGKKSLGPVFDGSFDVSRYEELPNVTVETVLEADLYDNQTTTEATMHSTLPMLRNRPDLDSKGVEETECKPVLDAAHNFYSNNYTIDRNSNSEITNIKNMKEPVANESTLSENNKSCINNTKSGAKSFNDHETSAVDMVHAKTENIKKNKCGVDAFCGYRENPGSRRIAPVIGPNG